MMIRGVGNVSNEAARETENHELYTAIAECCHGDDGVPAKGATRSHSSRVESDWLVATVCYSALTMSRPQ